MEDIMYDYFYRIENKHWWFQSRREIILRLINKYYSKKADCKVLDIGCGTGSMLNYLFSYGEVQGIDCSKKAIDYSKKKSPNAKVSIGSLPYDLPREKFDLILSLEVLEHVDKDDEALKSINNILKPEGTFILTVPANQFLFSAHDRINLHKRRYSLKELKLKLEKAGFEIKKISYYNTFLFIPATLVILFKKIFDSKKPKSHFEKIPHFFLNGILKTIFSMEKHLLPSVNFPCGVSLIAVVSKRKK